MKEYGVDLEKQLNHLHNKIVKRYKLVTKGSRFEITDDHENHLTFDDMIIVIKHMELDYTKKSKQKDMFDE